MGRKRDFGNLKVSVSGLGNARRIVSYDRNQPCFTRINSRRRQGNRNRCVGKYNHGGVTRISRGKISRPERRRVGKVRDTKISAEILKELKTDPEHYKIMRKRWKNIGIPDPTKNLTALRLDGKYLKFDNEPKGDKIVHCTKFHQEKIDKLHSKLENKVAQLHEKVYKDVSLNKMKYMDDLKRVSGDGVSLQNISKVLPVFESSVSGLEKIFERFTRERKNLEEKMLPEIRKLQGVKDEIHTFNSFYERKGNDGLNSMYMTKTEYSTLNDTEKWFVEMKKFYKS